MTLCALSPQHIPTLLKMASKIPTLKVLVAMEAIPEEEKKILTAWGQSVGIKVLDLEDGRLHIILNLYCDETHCICFF